MRLNGVVWGTTVAERIVGDGLSKHAALGVERGRIEGVREVHTVLSIVDVRSSDKFYEGHLGMR